MNNAPPYGRGFGFGDGGAFLVHHEGPGAFGWTIFALQLVLVLGVAWLLASMLLGSRLGRRQRPATPVAAAGPADEPLGVLRLRYARGEIDREAYLQASADLGAAGETET